MKAILEFNLDDFEDNQAHMRCVNSLSMALALSEIDEYLRIQLKYNEDSLTDEAYKAIEDTRAKFYVILEKNNISIDNLLK